VRFRNFTANANGDYEMMVNASPTRTPGVNQVNGQVPGGSSAYWAENNSFWITYDPLANSGAGNVSLRLVGSGRTSYDVTIGRAPDAVTAGLVNYIAFELWDRYAFPTLPGGITISNLEGQNLGSFTLPAAGIDSWAIIDPLYGATLYNGFILQGSFTVDVTKLDGGREGDKIIFGIGNHSEVPVPEPISMVMLGCVGAGMLAARKLRGKRAT